MPYKNFKVGDLAKLKKVTWRSIDGVLHLTDDTGPVISVKGKTKGHTSIYKYAIRMTRSICFTNKPLKP